MNEGRGGWRRNKRRIPSELNPASTTVYIHIYAV